MLGTLAVVVGTIAVAVVGLLMVSGHLDWRRGLTVALGCFLIFGAPIIADGLLGGAASSGPAAAVSSDAPADLPSVPAVSKPAYDPYAGAAPAMDPSRR